MGRNRKNELDLLRLLGRCPDCQDISSSLVEQGTKGNPRQNSPETWQSESETLRIAFMEYAKSINLITEKVHGKI